MHKALMSTVIAAAAAALVVGAALPAAAAGTTTTFVLGNGGGGLAITAPAATNLGSGTVGNGVSAGAPFGTQLGRVTVTDSRGALLATWTASVASTSFTTGTATAAETVPASAVTYWSGGVVSSTGAGAPVPGQATAAQAVPLGSAQPAFTHPIGVSNNSAGWDPTLTVTPPASAVVGTYSGTVTHSVA